MELTMRGESQKSWTITKMLRVNMTELFTLCIPVVPTELLTSLHREIRSRGKNAWNLSVKYPKGLETNEFFWCWGDSYDYHIVIGVLRFFNPRNSNPATKISSLGVSLFTLFYGLRIQGNPSNRLPLLKIPELS